jgi:3',5'-cyclic AMP phosphodiesterase CpdA
MNTILLRFRDVTPNIDTIQEHNRIILDKGYVWWGWWKKENEPFRNDILDSIKSRLKSEERLSIALFNRTARKFYIVEIEDIKFSNAKRSKSLDQQSTPEYYRTKLLFAWFKFVAIRETDLNEFKESVGWIPIGRNTLYKLPIDKHDNFDKCYPIKAGNILHLSDIHLGEDYGFPLEKKPTKTPLLERIQDYFNYRNKIDIDLLVISGDLTSKGNTSYLSSAVKPFLTDLCEILEIEKEQIIIVPGNHDIPLDSADIMTYKHESAFIDFLTNFYRDDKKELNGIDKFLTSDGIEIEFLRMNSSRLRTKEESNFGYLGWSDYRAIIENYHDKNSTSVKIAVLHHHLISVPNEEPISSDYPFGSVSVTIDSGAVIEGLQEYNYDIVLHGHQHAPGIHRVNRGMKTDSMLNMEKGLYICGTGSAGAKTGRLGDQIRNNSFSILLVKSDKVEIETVHYNPLKEPETYFKTVLSLNRT